MPASLVMGLQWGDEGKGRVVDALAAEADVVVRYNGGANAGHTIVDEQGTRRVTHQIPSGIRRAGVLNLIGRGVVVDPFKLAEEVRAWGARPGMLGIDPAAHVTLPVHIEADRGLEALRGRSAIGTTASGNGPTYADKHQRTGVRVIDVLRDPSWSASQLVIGRGVDQDEAERQVRAAGIDRFRFGEHTSSPEDCANLYGIRAEDLLNPGTIQPPNPVFPNAPSRRDPSFR